MREILYRNLTQKGNKKRRLYIKELVSKDGILARIERRCTYFVRKKVLLKSPKDMQSLRELKEASNTWKKKHFHILRRHSSFTGEDTLLCKTAGTCYAIVGQYVYSIAFVHSFKMDLAVVAVAKEIS